MNNNLINLVDEIEKVGNELNSVKAELRIKDFDLKVLKSKMEFSSEFEEFREGLKVKEIAPKILEATEEECREIINLKQKRDDLEHKLKVLELKFHCLKDIMESE